jgi:hypothetical protein
VILPGSRGCDHLEVPSCPLPRDCARLRRRPRVARSGRNASAPSGLVPTTATAGESERKPGPGLERLLLVLSVAQRTPPPAGRPSGHAPPERGRRAADARRHAVGLLNTGVPPEAPWPSSTSSRRPIEPGATTRSPCRLHGLLPASPRGPREVRHARRPHTLQAETPRPAPPRRPQQARHDRTMGCPQWGEGGAWRPAFRAERDAM